MEQVLERNDAGIPIRQLGRTGLKVSIIGLGGGHFCRKHIDEAASVRLVRTAIDEGLTCGVHDGVDLGPGYLLNKGSPDLAGGCEGLGLISPFRFP